MNYHEKLEQLRRSDRILRRMGQLREMLLSENLPDDGLRQSLQAEYRQLKAQLDNEMRFVKILWHPESKLLVYAENNTVISAISGDIAERKFNRIKELINIEKNNDYDNEEHQTAQAAASQK